MVEGIGIVRTDRQKDKIIRTVEVLYTLNINCMYRQTEGQNHQNSGGTVHTKYKLYVQTDRRTKSSEQ